MSLPSYAEFHDNLRWSLDASARLNINKKSDRTSRIYALGLDTHKVFSTSDGDFGYMVGQLYFTKLSDHQPVPWMFGDKDDSEFIVREAHINYTAGPDWLPNFRLGHFTMPFGLEESIDTNGRLLDYHHNKNLGTKLDWGLGINNVINHIEYNFSYTLGGKDKVESINDSYALTGRIGSLSYQDFIIGFSIYQSEIDQIKRRRIALDWQYYWGTWGILSETALGEDKKQNNWVKEKYQLIELNKTAINEQLKIYGQFIFTNRDDQTKDEKLINIGLSYQINTQLEVSLASRNQLVNAKSEKKEHLIRAQIRYRY